MFLKISHIWIFSQPYLFEAVFFMAMTKLIKTKFLLGFLFTYTLGNIAHKKNYRKVLNLTIL
jgi:hypothetical protein